MGRRTHKLQFNKAKNLWEPSLLEEHIVAEILTRLGYAGIKAFRVTERIPRRVRGRIRGRTSTPGIPDIMGWVRVKHGFNRFESPVPLFVEVKRPGGKIRPAQERFIREAKADGCVAFVAYSWEDVENELPTVRTVKSPD